VKENYLGRFSVTLEGSGKTVALAGGSVLSDGNIEFDGIVPFRNGDFTFRPRIDGQPI